MRWSCPSHGSSSLLLSWWWWWLLQLLRLTAILHGDSSGPTDATAVRRGRVCLRARRRGPRPHALSPGEPIVDRLRHRWLEILRHGRAVAIGRRGAAHGWWYRRALLRWIVWARRDERPGKTTRKRRVRSQKTTERVETKRWAMQ